MQKHTPESLLPKVIRGYIVPGENGQWEAFTLEFGLAVQAGSFYEAKHKLAAVLNCYVNEALGEDREHAEDLLTRRAPPGAFFRYHRIGLTNAVSRRLRKLHLHVKNFSGTTITEPLETFAHNGC